LATRRWNSTQGSGEGELTIEAGGFLLGLFGLYLGAEWLVKGSSHIARTFGVRPIVIGLTLVAFGTSSPELVVSLTAALNGSQGLAIGNIIGSNIANIGLILGLSALVSPLRIELSLLRRELPMMIAVSLLLCLMAIDLEIGFGDGLLLISGFCGYIGYHLFSAIKASRANGGRTYEVGANGGRAKNAILVIVGAALLVGGAHLMVQSGIMIARAAEISEAVVGLTLVAIGTSLPELATSLVSARRKASDICVGNVIGSTLFNILLIVGLVALVAPLKIDGSLLVFELPVMMLFSLALVPLMKSGSVLNRLEGAFLSACYFAFIAWEF
jgi:cation:H+ antiporter